MKIIPFLSAVCMLSGTLLAQTQFNEKESLKLYADFEGTAIPVLAEKKLKIDAEKSTVFAEGKAGKGIHFDSVSKDAHLCYRFGTPLDSAGEWSIALWIRPDGNSATNPKSYAYLFRTDNAGAWADGNITAFFCKWGGLRINRFNSDKKNVENTLPAALIPGKKWTHFAIVNRNGVITVYINGAESKLSGKQAPISIASTQKYIRIGGIDPTPESRFNGTLDELKIFNKALNSDQIRLIMDTRPGRETNCLPVLQMPFNGRMDCVCSTGAVMQNQSNVVFKPAVIGKGALFTRHGYDRAGRATVSDVFGINGPEMTFSAFFIPKFTDEQLRGIAGVKNADSTWSLLRKGNLIIFRLGNTELSAGMNWQNEKPVHLAASYSSKEKMMRLFADGKQIAGKAIPPFQSSSGKSILVLGDTIDGDTYSPTQAEGTLDEIRIFNTAMSAKAITAEIARKNDPSSSKEPLDQWSLPEKKSSVQEKKLWAVDGAETRRTKDRITLTLNALWRFQLTLPGNQPSAEKWCFMAVPGRFAGYENGMSDHIYLMRDKNLKTMSEDLEWEGVPGYKINTSFWERELSVKPEWKNKRWFITFEDFSAETGRLFINGRFVAEIKGQTPHRIPIEKSLLRFDRPNWIQLSLNGVSGRWAWRGVKGAVALELLPEISIEQPQIITSVRNKTIEVRSNLLNGSKEKQSLRLKASIRGKNAPNPFYSKEIELQPGEEKTLTLLEKWQSPLLWDFENPNLYDCILEVIDGKGNTIDSAFPIRFGFREFRIDGKNYKLNEKTVHLFNADEIPNFTTEKEVIKKQFHALKEFGFNSIRLSFGTVNDNMKAAFDAADEEGILLFPNVRGVGGNEYSLWNERETRERLEKEMSAMIVAWRNHPSIVMWYVSVNFLGYSLDYHPMKMTDGYLPKSRENQFKTAQEGAKILLKYDDTRPFFYQAGGAHGQVLNANAYFCWWPQAERRTWAEEWRKIGTKPLHIIETSFPYFSSMQGMDKQFGESVSKIKFIHENAARYLGNEAYDGSQKLVNTYVEGSRDGKYFFPVTLATQHFRNFKTYSKMKDYLLRDTIRHWRASGISGISPFGEFQLGFKRLDFKRNVTPTDFRRFNPSPDIQKSRYQLDCDTTKPLPFGFAIKDSFAPILMFIGGPEAEPTSEAANYTSGEHVERTLFLINDTLKNQEFNVSVTLTGKNVKSPVFEQSFHRTLAAGEIVRLPFQMKMPETETKAEYILNCHANSPAGIKEDRSEITLFPKIHPAKQGKIAFYDAGFSRKDLINSGIKFDDAGKLQNLNGYDLLIVGSRALDSNEFSAWAKRIALAASDVNILLLEQSAAGLEKLGFKSIGNDTRNVFKITTDAFPHSLSERELANWAGNSTLVKNKPEPTAEEYITIPQQLWRWNTINTTASTPIRRTGKGRTVSHLSCGLDLAYSALLEVKSPERNTILCQMEVSGRTDREPAAARLLADMAERWSVRIPPAKTEKSILVTNPANVEKYGLTTEKIRVREMQLTSEGKRILGDLSKRDLFFATPLNVFAVKGENVIPLTEDGALSMLRTDGGTVYFACIDRSHLNKRLAETKAISRSLSDYWGQHVMLERIEQLLARLSGESSPDLAKVMESPKITDTVFSLAGEWFFEMDPKRVGLTENWQKKTEFSGWRKITVPSFWETHFGKYDGIAWYAKTVNLPEKMRNCNLVFHSDAIDDLDDTYVNGTKIGSTGESTEGYWTAPRNYTIPKELTRSGKLTILIRVNDLRGDGGISGRTYLIERNSKASSVDFPYDLESYPTYHTESAIRW